MSQFTNGVRSSSRNHPSTQARTVAPSDTHPPPPPSLPPPSPATPSPLPRPPAILHPLPASDAPSSLTDGNLLERIAALELALALEKDRSNAATRELTLAKTQFDARVAAIEDIVLPPSYPSPPPQLPPTPAPSHLPHSSSPEAHPPLKPRLHPHSAVAVCPTASGRSPFLPPKQKPLCVPHLLLRRPFSVLPLHPRLHPALATGHHLQTFAATRQ